MSANETNVCPVCGQSVLEAFEVCPVCDWQNDRVQIMHPDMEGGANNMSLNQAKQAWKNGEIIR